MEFVVCLFLFTCFAQCWSEQAFTQDVTEKVFGTPVGISGIIAAYGDVNNDKITDIFVLSGADNRKISVFLGSDQNDIGLRLGQSFNFSKKVDSIAPADFNGDGKMDLLLTSKSDQVYIDIIWGEGLWKLSTNVYSSHDVGLLNQPLLVDANADMIVDLFVARKYPNGTIGQFWLGHTGTNENWEFQKCPSISNMTNIGKTHSHAFVDFTGDRLAELVVRTNSSFDVWKASGGGLSKIESIAFPSGKSNLIIGQSVFADVNGDGYVDFLLPICENSNGKCKESKILMYQRSERNWVSLFHNEEGWNFVQAPSEERFITLVVGDYNGDVLVDILCVMQRSNKPPTAVVLYGAPCGYVSCQNVGRSFEFSFEVPRSNGAIMASFYDLKNDGKLDILVSVANNNSRHTLAFLNTISADVSFLNAKVLPGLESDGASNIPGACVAYTTTNVEGGEQESAACQLTQTAYFALQLPYINFGLGRLPNYVDSISVSVPSPLVTSCGEVTPDSEATRCRNWTMIIPNSQLFIKPYPSNEPDRWVVRMWVTPSQNIITTAAVLLGSCLVVTIAIIVLHCMEKRDDLQEKIKDSQRFHFDAM